MTSGPASPFRRYRSPPILAFLLTAGLYASGAMEKLGYWLLDAQYVLLQHDVASDIVVVEIDAQSLNELEVWPWPRRLHGELLDRLVAAGARHVFFDIDFSTRSTPVEDDLFAASLAAAPAGTVLLPAFQQPATSSRDRALVSRPVRAASRIRIKGEIVDELKYSASWKSMTSN